MLKGGLTLAFVASSCLLLAGVSGAPLPLVLVALFFTIASNGVIATTASSLAMQSQGHCAGSASVISMTATIFGCFMLAIVMFMLLAQKPKSA
ncbi:hypothetical protein E05_12160 [Plautia stali symbiont]|nr:hypothetical protein E05_12160 [Plautia stali symbiont]